ncbi:ATP-grasp domain-containing protein [Pasteurella multocida]|uniref:ATP-grasp domain-containing protein n=1 Tax=Pasteurella multocida TaxID=747 RepID=UPI003978C810
MKVNVIVVQAAPGFHANWLRLSASLGERYAFHLLVPQENIAAIPKDYLPVFSSVTGVTAFTPLACQQAVESIACKQKISCSDVIFIAKDEESLDVAARLREINGARGTKPADILPFINKLVMKERVSLAGIPIPGYLAFDPGAYKRSAESWLNFLEEKLTYPLFTKQIDSAGSKDARKIHSRSELMQWCSEHAECDNYEIDEFIEGELFHVDTLISQGEVLLTFVSRYNRPNAEALLGLSLGSTLMSENMSDYAALKEFNRDVLNSLTPLPDGAFHHEIFKRPNGQLVFLEIAARSAGAFIPKMLEKAYGLNIEELHFMAQLGEVPPRLSSQFQQYAAWLFFPPRPGVIEQCSVPELTVEHELFWRHSAGEELRAPASMADRVLGVVLWSEDVQQLTDNYSYLQSGYQPFTLRDEAVGTG